MGITILAKPTVPLITLQTASKDEEYFEWMSVSFNISGIRQAISSGRLRPSTEKIEAEFIERYCTKVLALDKANPHKKTFSVLMGVDGPRAHGMPDTVLEIPIIFAYAGKNKGLLNLDGTGAHYLLIDGNHRMAKAFYTNTPGLPAVVLNQAQVRPYKS